MCPEGPFIKQVRGVLTAQQQKDGGLDSWEEGPSGAVFHLHIHYQPLISHVNFMFLAELHSLLH